MRPVKLALAFAFALAATALLAGPAAADSPWWHLTVGSRPSTLPATPGEKGQVILTVANLGDAIAGGEATPVVVEDKLPPHLKKLSIEAITGPGFFSRGNPSCKKETLTCTFKGTLLPYDQIEVRIGVETLAGASSGEADEVLVSGGLAPPRTLSRPLAIGPGPVPFGVEDYELSAEEAGGAASTRAASHPFQLTTTIAVDQLASTGSGADYEAKPAGMVKDIDFHWPAGLLGNPSPVPQCTLAQFLTTTPSGGTSNEEVNACPQKSAVGVAMITVDGGHTSAGGAAVLNAATFPVPIFDLEPGFGEPARFGFFVGASNTPVIIDPALRSANGQDYGVDVKISNTIQTVSFLSSKATVWGVPGDSRHDDARGYACIYEARGLTAPGLSPCKAAEEEHPKAFLRMPSACSGQALPGSVETDSWLEPGSFLSFAAEPPMSALDSCNQVPFAPKAHSEPTADATSSGTGLNFNLDVEDEGLTAAAGTGASDIEKAIVTLPEGMSADASLAEGLGVCGEGEYKATRISQGSGCPETSKIGSLEAESPLVAGKVLQGSLYIAKPGENPFDSLLAMYMVIRNPELGVLVKAAGHIEADPRTGQLITTFDNLPQLPISHFRLHLREGQRAPLITPPTCGTYTVKAVLFPYSEPSHGIEDESPFRVDHGVNGGPCPPSTPPFHPGFEAGAQNNVAGSYSPFALRLTRADGEQDLTRFSTVLPPGMVGKIAGVSKCPQASIEAAKHSSGHQEQSSPSCPASSKIGRTLAGAGVGSTLVYVPGSLYLAGPYHGDPLSVAAIVPAVAGPFDVGTVVVQEALTLNPLTAEVEVDGAASDPIPHILAGIPLNVRDIRVFTDRPGFTLNPTSCAPSATRATLWGGGTDVFSSADDVPIALASRFQAADCAALGFRPNLSIALKGGTKRGKFPALSAEVAPRAGDANFRSAVVTLPHSAFLEQGHFGTICTRVQFAASGGNGAGCPPASIYGHARAISPLLEEPLEGPVYLRSSNHNLPDLVVALHGLVNIDLDARIDSVKGGIRSSFEAIPDAPVSKFVLEMEGGRKGLIVNSTNICKGSHLAEANLTGQNGRLDKAKPAVASASCAKAKKHKKKRKRHAHRGRVGGR